MPTTTMKRSITPSLLSDVVHGWRVVALAAVFAWSVGFSAAGAESTVLGVDGSRFALDGKPRFLLGFSYYGALGAPENRPRRSFDLRDRGLFDQLDAEERNVVSRVRAVVAGATAGPARGLRAIREAPLSLWESGWG